MNGSVPTLASAVEPAQLLRACGEDPSWACEQVLLMSGNATLASTADFLLGRPLRIAGIIVIAIIAHRVAKRAINRLAQRAEEHTTRDSADELDEEAARRRARAPARIQALSSVATSVAGAVIWLVVVLTVLGEVGISIGPLIAGAGVLGVALGFGAQSVVQDLLAGMFILAEDQYGVGDVVDVGEAFGVIEEIHFRTTRIRDLNGMLWYVRNGEITRTANASQGWGRAVLDIEVAYETDLRRAGEVIKRVADEAWRDPELGANILEEPEIWGIQDLGSDGIAIRLVVKTKPATQWGLGRELRLRVKEAFDGEGIEIPFPQRTVWLRTEAATAAQALPVRRVGDPEDG